MSFNELPMLEALNQAKIAFKQDEIPVGAVIVNRKTQKIISAAYNQVEKAKNPLLHAETLAIAQACKLLSTKSLTDHDIYITLEPCLMCACAIAHARIDRVFYGAHDLKHGAVESNIRFFNSSACFHRPEIYAGLLSSHSEFLMKEFFKKIRLLTRTGG